MSSRWKFRMRCIAASWAIRSDVGVSAVGGSTRPNGQAPPPAGLMTF